LDGTSSSQVVKRISFFSRREGDATAFCERQRHRVHDVVLGRNEAALEGYWHRLPGKERVRLVCMDLSSSYRALVRKHSRMPVWWPTASMASG
jgi:transposase